MAVLRIQCYKCLSRAMHISHYVLSLASYFCTQSVHTNQSTVPKSWIWLHGWEPPPPHGPHLHDLAWEWLWWWKLADSPDLDPEWKPAGSCEILQSPPIPSLLPFALVLSSRSLLAKQQCTYGSQSGLLYITGELECFSVPFSVFPGKADHQDHTQELWIILVYIKLD